MNCKLQNGKPDWKAYALGELDPAARREAEQHASACDACQEEMAGLRVTLDALSTLREEEVPRRIAFVSDKVFEPRWWNSLLRPSFAAGALIAAAILVHAFVRPPVIAPAQAVDTAAIEALVRTEMASSVKQAVNQAVSQAVNQAVTQAVAETRKSDDRRTAELLAATERRYDETTAYLGKQVTQIYAVNSGLGVR